MIKLFSGEDDFQSYLNAKQEATKIATSKNSQVKIIDSEDISNIEDLLQEIDGLNMFSTGSVILLKRIFSNKKVSEYLTENYKSIKEQDIVLWVDGNADGRNKLTQSLKKEGLLFQYELPKERDFKNWIRDYAKSLKLSLGESEIEYILQNVGVNKYVIQNELKKISLFAKNQQRKVTSEDLKVILGFESKGNIWTLLDNFGKRKRKEAIKEFIKLTTFEDNTQYIIAMLERELSILSQIKYCESNNLDKRELKLHPFVLQKSSEKARNFKWEEIKFFMAKLLNLDFAIKNGDVDEKLGMSLYILSI